MALYPRKAILNPKDAHPAEWPDGFVTDSICVATSNTEFVASEAGRMIELAIYGQYEREHSLTCRERLQFVVRNRNHALPHLRFMGKEEQGRVILCHTYIPAVLASLASGTPVQFAINSQRDVLKQIHGAFCELRESPA